MARYLTRPYGARSFPGFKKTLIIGILAAIVVIIIVVYIFTLWKDEGQIPETPADFNEVTEAEPVELIEQESLPLYEPQLEPEPRLEPEPLEPELEPVLPEVTAEPIEGSC